MGRIGAVLGLFLLALPATAMAQFGAPSAASDLDQKVKSTMEFIAEQAAMAGAAGVCQAEAYALIRSCSVNMVTDVLRSLQNGGPDQAKAAQVIQTGADRLWHDVVATARQRQLGSSPPMSCAQVAEKVRDFGAKACIQGQQSGSGIGQPRPGGMRIQ